MTHKKCASEVQVEILHSSDPSLLLIRSAGHSSSSLRTPVPGASHQAGLSGCHHDRTKAFQATIKDRLLGRLTPHLRRVKSHKTYSGLAGLLAIGRTDENLPVVTEKKIPIRNMVLQYNAVYGCANREAQLNNMNWPQYVSSIVPPNGDELAKETYRPLLTPVNFTKFAKGFTFFTVWYSGPLSIHNNRGRLQTIPSNLQTFRATKEQGGNLIPADPSLPDYLRRPDNERFLAGIPWADRYQIRLRRRPVPELRSDCRSTRRHQLYQSHVHCSGGEF
jgi:hypothetical protein